VGDARAVQREDCPQQGGDRGPRPALALRTRGPEAGGEVEEVAAGDVLHEEEHVAPRIAEDPVARADLGQHPPPALQAAAEAHRRGELLPRVLADCAVVDASPTGGERLGALADALPREALGDHLGTPGARVAVELHGAA